MSIIQQTVQYLLDTFFPQRCLGCGTYDMWMCEKCLTHHRSVKRQSCSQQAKAVWGIDSIVTLGPYADPFWRTAVELLKFHAIEDLANPLGAELARAFLEPLGTMQSCDVIIPIPVHKKTARRRGYNQSFLLASALSRATGIPVRDDVLIRAQASRSQTQLSHEKRKENVSGVFALSEQIVLEEAAHIVGTSILLVDDVVTTGSTSSEAAKTLQVLHPSAIHLCAIARG